MNHPLDRTTQLVETAKGQYQGKITQDYANMVGPFGGTIAAVLVNAVLQHPERLGDPVALTVNFAGPIADAPFTIEAKIARTNRSTQHWLLTLVQEGETAITATAMTAVRKPTWSSQELPFPSVPNADQVPINAFGNVTPWVRNYQLQFTQGLLTMNQAHRADSSLSQLWVRDQPERPLDYVSLTAISDVFFPRLFIRLQQPAPAGTVSMTIYYHADQERLAAVGTKPLLAQARAQQFYNGYADQTAELFSDDGHLLVTTNQLVYYKA